MVRRGLAPTVLRMRIASIMTATPAPLSVAPTDECQLSRCAPSNTISLARSDPGSSATTFIPFMSISSWNCGADIELHLHGQSTVEYPHQPVVVLDRQRDLRWHLAGVLVARAARLDEDCAAVDALGHRRQVLVAAHRHHGLIATAIEHGRDAFREVELQGLFGERRSRRRRRARGDGGGNRQPLGLGQHLVAHSPGDAPFEHSHVASRLGEHDLAAQLAAVFLEVGFRANRDADHVAGHQPLRARRPCLGIADERLPLRLQEMRLEVRQ